MAQTDQILKVDAVGRVWTPRARREEVLDELERSGMSAGSADVRNRPLHLIRKGGICRGFLFCARWLP